MAELPVSSIEKQIKNANIANLVSTSETDSLLKVLKEKRLNLQLEKEKVKVMICCSIKDMNIGVRVKEMLTSLGIEGFMAYDGHNLSGNFKMSVIDELNECEVFIPILSDNFRNSNYCSQELGIAYFRNLLIIPLSLNGTIPYGFISDFKHLHVNRNNIPLEYIIKPMVDYFPGVNIKGKLINALKKAYDFRSAEDIMKNLEPYFDKLSNEEVNNIIDIFIENNQNHATNLCRMEHLHNFIMINMEKIENNNLELILDLIREDEENRERAGERLLGN